MRKFQLGFVLVLVTLVSLAVTVAAVASSTRQAATTVVVTAGKPSELKFTLSKRTVPKGLVTFTVTNKGKLAHDFKIAGKRTVVLKPGKTATLKVTFAKAGTYAYLCTVPGHGPGGMKGTLTVK